MQATSDREAEFEEARANEEELDAFMADHEDLLAAADAYERESQTCRNCNCQRQTDRDRALKTALIQH